MRKAISQQMSFGDSFIDRSLYELDEELKKVDELLSSPALVRPFEEVYDESQGRPGTPVGIYLRMMYLKFRWGLSYEEVETKVRERLPWRYFCHLSLMDTVPDATTLIKLNQRFGEERMGELNRQLIKSLVKTRSIKPRRIWIDSTTWKPTSHIPTISGSSIKRSRRLPARPVLWAARSSAMCGLTREPWPVGAKVPKPNPKSVKPKVKKCSRK